MTAMNWSPGGCCCPSDDILDIYWGTQGVQNSPTPGCARWDGGGLFRRVTSNKTAIESWFIDPSTNMEFPQRIITAAGDGEKVWARYFGSDNSNRIARFNIDAQVQEYTNTHTSPGSGQFFEAASQTHHGLIQFENLQFNSHRFEVHSDGGRQFLFFRFEDDNITQLAPRYWPHGCGVQGAGNLTFYLFSGIQIIGTQPQGHLTVTGKQTVFTASGFAPGFLFDQTPDGWAGVVSWASGNGSTRNIVFLINGIEVEALSFPINDTDQPTIISVHVSHPHETIGAVVAVVRRVPGFNPPRQKFETYDLITREKLGETESFAGSLTCSRSSDRWLYVGTPRLSVEDMPGEVLETPGSGSLSWMLRHDCSESVPLNQLVRFATGHDVMRNSRRFEFAPPLENFPGRACD